MISIYQLKPFFQQFLRPLVKNLVKLGVTANQITMGTIMLSLCVGALLWFYGDHTSLFWIMPIFLFIRMALNAIDGIIAKEFNMKSALGNILNEIGDVISDIILYIPFFHVAGVSSFLIVGIVISACISEFAGVLTQVVGASRRFDGPVGKSDRAFLFGILSILIALEVSITTWVNYILLFTLIGILLNTVIRIQKGLKEVRYDS